MDDVPDPELEEQVEQLEAEAAELEWRLAHSAAPGAEVAAGRLRRLHRQLVDASPDSLFSPSTGGGIKGIARRTDSYGFVLLLLGALIWVFVPLATSEKWAVIPTVIVYGLSIIIALHTSYVRQKWLHAAITVIVALVTTIVVGFVMDNAPLRIIGNTGFGLVMLLTAAVIIRRVMRHQSVTSRTISGAVAVYLLIGLAFADAFVAVELWHPGSFTNLGERMDYSPLQYFSFVTIATLGYGDITPVSSAARSLATLEAVMGQIFLVTIVARLVSMFGTSTRRPDMDDHPAPGPEGPAPE